MNIDDPVTLDLFSVASQNVHFPTIQNARVERDAAIQQVQENAEALTDWKTEDAARFVLAYAQQVGGPFTSEDVVDKWNDEGGALPHDSRAWGPAFLMAMKRGWVKRSTEVYQRRKGHAAPSLKWELA
jgi:hypothetical protein